MALTATVFQLLPADNCRDNQALPDVTMLPVAGASEILPSELSAFLLSRNKSSVSSLPLGIIERFECNDERAGNHIAS